MNDNDFDFLKLKVYNNILDQINILTLGDYNPNVINQYLPMIEAHDLYYNTNSNDYIFVIIASHYLSAIESVGFIANYSKHKLKMCRPFGNSILLVFKKFDRCNNWK
jgi:hypothetical protein